MEDHSATLVRHERRNADRRASTLASQGRLVVRTLGAGLPLPLVRASGLTPIALATADEVAVVLPDVELDAHGRAQLAAVVQAPPGQALLVATSDTSGARLFAALRELMRTGDLPTRPLQGIDLLRPGDAALRRYNDARLRELAAWLVSLGGTMADSAALAESLETDACQLALLERLDSWRMRSESRVRGSAWREARLAAEVMDPGDHIALLSGWLDTVGSAPSLVGERVFVAGVAEAPDGLLESIELLGLQVVADDWTLAEALAGGKVPLDDPWHRLAARPAQPAAMPPDERARWTLERAQRVGANRLVHLRVDDDEAQAWLRPHLEAACCREGVTFSALDVKPSELIPHAVLRALSGKTALPPRPAIGATPAEAKPTSRSSAGAPEQRSRKSLQAVADFGRYQRDWFQSVRERALAGEPFALVNADAPQEILRAFDIPFVVNQWWASIVAAKQQSARYITLLAMHGYPTDAEPYSAQGLAAALEDQPDLAPWGGLPRPDWLMAFSGTPATRGIYAAMAQRTGAELCLFDRTVDTRVDLPIEWWQRLPHEWDDMLEAPRLDLIEHQFSVAIERIQASTGRRFDEARFVEVLDLVNEQENYYRLTRDLIASCPRAPVGIVDTMPATMVPQWHRGTAWGRDAARALYEEVRKRAQRNSAACPGERLRLMWVGRGLWSDMGFYQRWEASHGAVFVWSMYLALAADGYLRYRRDDQSPRRALAARFVTMGDELRMPTWAGAWHVREAATHRVDAAVAIDDADPLVLRALEADGVPVLRLALNNFGAGTEGRDGAAQRVAQFLDTLRKTRVS